MRIGFGYDVHPLAPGAALVLGGVRIPHESGLQGHSDADVVVHALCDAMLGAAALGDIGQHFPSSDEPVGAGFPAFSSCAPSRGSWPTAARSWAMPT